MSRRIIGFCATSSPPGRARACRFICGFYRNCPAEHHVDHIVPIKNDLVCGLHVVWNLQYLPYADNLRKRNHFSQFNYEAWVASGETEPFLG
jgi:hypothetical protein